MSENAGKTTLPPTSEKKKLLYGSPRLGINIFMGIVDFALLFLYESAYGLRPILVGVALMAGKLAAGIGQFLIPWMSDHANTKWGRRKPFLVVMAPILAGSFIMLLLPGLILKNPTEMALFGWFMLFNIIAQASYAVVSIYHSWSAEQFPSNERPKVSQIQNIFNFVGLAIVVIFSFVVLTKVKDDLQADPTTIPPNFLTAIIIFALMLIGMLWMVAFVMPKENTPVYPDAGFKQEIKNVMENKNYVYVTLMHGFSSLAWAMINGVMLGYVDTVLMLEGTDLYIAVGMLAVGMLLFIQFWRTRIEAWGKKKTLVAIFTVAIITLPLTILGLFAWAANVWVGALIMLFIAASQGGWSLFPYILYADCAEDDEKKTGQLKAGLYYGFPALVLNIFQAFSLLFTGWILSLPDVENIEGNSFSLGYVLWGPISAIILFFTLIYVKKFIQIDYKWEEEQNSI